MLNGFPINKTMRTRMEAGLSFLYTTRDGHEWFIDATLNFPFRQIDLSEAMYDAFDGRDFEPGFPSLAVCQFALEEGCPQWRGEGWYLIGNGDDIEAVRINTTDELKEKVAIVRGRHDVYDTGWTADYAGNGSKPVKIY